MAKRVSNTAVGGFVVAAMVIILAAVMVFGSGSFFRKKYEFVCFFPSDLNGLKIGASVKMRGVQIGSVTNIKLRLPEQAPFLQSKGGKTALPVFFEIDEEQVKALGTQGDVGSRATLSGLIQLGLRAQLNTESLLTGLLYVDLNFHPNAPLVLVLPPDSQYREVPAISTEIEQIQEAATSALAKLDKIDFKALIDALTGAADAARGFIGSPDLKRAIAQLDETVISLRETSQAIGKATGDLDKHLDPLITSLRKTSDQATATLASTQATLAGINGTVNPSSPIGYRIVQTLDDLDEASRSLTALSDMLQRNPSAIIRGKAQAGSEK
jgi:phospholipid/cholesterol/gamma-HCH transport system substrate-binding protein